MSTVSPRTAIVNIIEMASNSMSDPDLDDFLKNNQLYKYKENILKSGVEQIEDLQDIMDDEVLTEIGMTPEEMNRFKTKVTEVLGLVSIYSNRINLKIDYKCFEKLDDVISRGKFAL